ncbi:MAG TPA: quinone oxidoreductase [Aliidongia sp.]|uniref:quinone oxidoreductase family protein n=1 Tax=Aliidongia sp. TaxID=1914230 RepID=UPI002DDD574C|nr:quinone oxidoreductase [Aliidongia sp.]HEV2677966.1 quinone oxidoreductase [Aliidongia sp.]
MHALAFDRFGDADVLVYRQLPDPEIPPGTVQIALEAAGLNFADIYRRRGDYVIAGAPPYILGYEGAGTVVGLGAGVHDFSLGDRVGFADVPFANATRVNVPVDHAIPLPPAITCRQAAAVMLQGLTALYLIEDSVKVEAGQTILVHAAAGGVGQMLVTMCRGRGAQVIGLASTPEKRAVALANGASAALGYDDDWVGAVRQASGGLGVDIAYDSVGSTLPGSLATLRPGGRAVIYGMAGGDPPPIAPRDLLAGSLSLIGGDLWTYLDSRTARRERAARLFAAVTSGSLPVPPIEIFPLADGAAAHRKLERRQVIGKIILVP